MGVEPACHSSKSKASSLQPGVRQPRTVTDLLSILVCDRILRSSKLKPRKKAVIGSPTGGLSSTLPFLQGEVSNTDSNRPMASVHEKRLEHHLMKGKRPKPVSLRTRVSLVKST